MPSNGSPRKSQASTMLLDWYQVESLKDCYFQVRKRRMEGPMKSRVMCTKEPSIFW